MSLDKGLSVLFIYSKTQLLVLLIFTIVSFISFSFISALIFMISFLQKRKFGFFGVFLGGGGLILCCCCCSLSSCFRCKVRLSIQCFSCFLV